MREHHAFWLACCSRRVDDSSEIFRRSFRGHPIDEAGIRSLLFAALLFELGQRQAIFSSDSLRIEENDVFDLGTLAQYVFQLQKLLAVREKQRTGARVVENVTDLRRRQRRIDRHVDRTRKQTTGVSQRPFDATI